MIAKWNKKTASPLQDMKALSRQIRKPSKFKPDSFYYKGNQYTLDELIKTIREEKVKGRN